MKYFDSIERFLADNLLWKVSRHVMKLCLFQTEQRKTNFQLHYHLENWLINRYGIITLSVISYQNSDDTTTCEVVDLIKKIKGF